MRNPGVVGSLQTIHVFVTLEALWTLDSVSVREVLAALKSLKGRGENPPRGQPEVLLLGREH
jgi:hypothetical protein